MDTVRRKRGRLGGRAALGKHTNGKSGASKGKGGTGQVPPKLVRAGISLAAPRRPR